MEIGDLVKISPEFKKTLALGNKTLEVVDILPNDRVVVLLRTQPIFYFGQKGIKVSPEIQKAYLRDYVYTFPATALMPIGAILQELI